jgi:DNA polymerase-3 subunit delta'
MVEAADKFDAALPWLAAPLQQTLREQRSHALMVHGPSGVGQFELALGLAQGWLCEAESSSANPSPLRPCGRCAACHLVRARSHPDLLVLVPEALRAALGWEPDADADDAGDKASKAKPSKDIKVEAVRSAVAFAQTTSARGRGKVVVLHPAERMNAISANTLLKTLEEPPGEARFVLSSGAPDALLPTIRSRCQAVTLTLPATDVAIEWLRGQGVADPGVLLAAAGGQPQDALAWSRDGVDAALWSQLPMLVQRGATGAIAGWPLPRLIESLQKLCHDALCVAAGAAPRYFPAASLKGVKDATDTGGGAATQPLHAWQRELQRAARFAEHPWNAGLLAESLVEQGRAALESVGRRGPSPRVDSVHSRA